VATDWADYATAIEAAFAERPGWSGGVVDRPSWRPVTRYEQRALREGRDVVDLLYVRA
jgi:tRNA (guanine-N7-)-methyltransferase